MQPKNRVIAALLALSFGFLGAHKIYLNRFGAFIGFLFLGYLSFSINMPIVFFVAIYQGFKLLSMSDIEFDRKYNKGYARTPQGPLQQRRDNQMRQYGQYGQQNPQYKSPQKSNQRPVNNPYIVSGMKKYKDFDLEDAIIDFQKGLEISPENASLHFNIACAYSLTEKKEKAFHHLSKAVSLGLTESDRILRHDDLAFVRIQPEFDAFRKSGFKVFQPTTTTQNQTQDKNQPPQEPVELEDQTNETLLERLHKLAELRERGLISDLEFEAARKNVLRN